MGAVTAMREIKFRGRDGDDWYYGSLFVNECGHTAISAPKSFWMKPVNADTVGQFTGLLDSNGKEIFEGDILRFAPPWRWEEDERRVGVVVYKCYGFRIEYSDRSEALFNLAANEAPYTIIGNIHDSPELLGADHERD